MAQSSAHLFSYFLIVILSIQIAFAITGNTSNHILWKGTDGSLIAKGNTSSYHLSASSYIQPVGNYTNSYVLCEGYYCIQRYLTGLIPGRGAGGAGLCQQGYILVYLNNKLVCVPEEQYNKLKEGIPLKKDYFFYGILFIIIFFLIRRRKKRKRMLKEQQNKPTHFSKEF